MTMHSQRASPTFEVLDGVPVVRVAGSLLAWHERLPGILRRCCYLLALIVLGWRLWQSRRSYDLIHVFQLSLFMLPALAVCRLARKPLVIAMRCDEPPLGQGKHSGSWAGLEGLARLGRPALRLINSQLRQIRACIVVLSTHMRMSLQRFGLDGCEIRLIPNGVDLASFSPLTRQEADDLTVVCVAKFRYQKGLDVLLSAWKYVVEQIAEARLILVGDGPLQASLQALAADLGICSSVEFAGLCPDVTQQYRRGRIAVLPSRWEGMPNALLEAMACGRACIATRVSGSADILGQEEQGLLVEPEDSHGLAAALWLLLSEPALVERYSRAARQHVERHYEFSCLMERHIELYYELYQGKPQQRLAEIRAVEM